MDLTRCFAAAVRKYWQAVLAYESGAALVMSDEAFDRLEQFLFGGIGIPTRPAPKQRTVKHAYFVPSLQKTKTQEALDAWAKRLPTSVAYGYAASVKLDGIHLTLTYKDGKLVQAATRGDGETGKDVTRAARYLHGVPNELPFEFSGVVEGEAILQKAIFQDFFAPAYTTARATVAGLLNADSAPAMALRRIDFLAFEMYDAEAVFKRNWLSVIGAYDHVKLLALLKRLGFEIPYTKVVASLGAESLTAFVQDAKRQSPYQCDGVVLRALGVNPLDAKITGKYPQHACAFKVDGDGAETSVTKVTWAESRTGFWAPTIHFEPVVIDGVTITKCTGHNAKDVFDKGIGRGAVITVARMGDVIPGVDAVLSKTTSFMMPPAPHIWNKTKTHLLVPDAGASQEAKALALENAFKVLKLKGVGIAVARQLVAAGYQSLSDFAGQTQGDFVGKGFGDGVATTLNRLVQTLFGTTWPRPMLMTASGLFPPGIGVARARKVLADKTYFETSDNAEAVAIRSKWRAYLAFEAHFLVAAETATPSATVVFSGFRDDAIVAKVQAAGFGVAERVTRNCVAVFAVDGNTSKVKDAIAFGVAVYKVSGDKRDATQRAAFVLKTLESHKT
jgi:NAD-dependent DNA ligase